MLATYSNLSKRDKNIPLAPLKMGRFCTFSVDNMFKCYSFLMEKKKKPELLCLRLHTLVKTLGKVLKSSCWSLVSVLLSAAKQTCSLFF